MIDFFNCKSQYKFLDIMTKPLKWELFSSFKRKLRIIKLCNYYQVIYHVNIEEENLLVFLLIIKVCYNHWIKLTCIRSPAH